MHTLYVGNSFTARNDVPGQVAAMAREQGIALTHDLLWAGGASLRAHWNKGVAQERMREARPGWVVLQEQSTLPVKNATRFHENVRLFVDAVREAGARLALYQTWARRATPEHQALLSRAYRDIGEELGAVVIPVGEVWERVLAEPSPPVLHDRDGSHPSAAGSYLAACVTARVLHGVDLTRVGFVAKGVDEEAARRIRAAASSA